MSELIVSELIDAKGIPGRDCIFKDQKKQKGACGTVRWSVGFGRG